MYKIIKLTHEAFFEDYISVGKKLQPCILYAQHETPFAWICNHEMCDFDYIKENNIRYKKLIGCNGTTVVSSKGDLGISVFGPIEFIVDILNRITKLFHEKINGADLVGNDFIYNGHKYGAITRTELDNGVHYMAIQISNNLDRELIAKICKKAINKIPASLPNPITIEDIANICSDGVKYDKSEYDKWKTE